VIEQAASSSADRVSGSSRRPAATLRAFVPILVTGVVLALLPLRYGDSRTMMNVVTVGVLFAAYTIAFNLIFGSTGQLFLCVGALAGLGGYTSAILSGRYDVALIPSLVLAAALSALMGGLLSWVAVRRSLDVIFTAVVTLAFSLAFDNLLLGQRDLTGGETGLVLDAGADTFLRDRVPRYYLFVALVLVYLVLYRILQRSHIGWGFRALRDDQVAAELAGVEVTRYRVFAGLTGSAMLGLAGALYAHAEGFISPTTYGFGRVDVRVLVMLALGGIGSLLGPVVGAAGFTILDEWLVPYSQLRLVYYGVAMLVLFLGFRRGVVPSVERAVAAARRRRARTERA
jgi:ABC-type branched-subunit amino acid transport system permease subunit